MSSIRQTPKDDFTTLIGQIKQNDLKLTNLTMDAVTSDQFKEICDALSQNQTITSVTLHLKKNKLPSNAVNSLQQMLRKNQAILKLDLGKAYIDEDDEENLESTIYFALKVNQSLLQFSWGIQSGYKQDLINQNKILLKSTAFCIKEFLTKAIAMENDYKKMELGNLEKINELLELAWKIANIFFAITNVMATAP